MKPRKLTMSAFCPYSSQVEIDFESFGEGGLFLITGETGAGKTTIFDGISYALYGEVSGENRGVDTIRSDFANPYTATFVEFIFEHKGHTYEINRNPKYNRPVKRGDIEKTTIQNADAHMLLPNNCVVTGASVVSEEVVKLLGINHKQFKQIAMIAQGEFLKLLLADSKERGIIFRKVFGTELYEKIQQELKYRSLALKNNLDDIKAAILQYNEGVLCSEDDENYEELQKLKCSVHGLPDLISILEKLIEKTNSEKVNLITDEKNISEKIEKKVAKISQAQQINELFNRLEQGEKHIVELKATQPEIENQKLKLDLGKKAVYQVHPAHKEAKSFEARCTELFESIENNKKIIEESTPIRELKLAELDNLKEEEPKREALNVRIKKIEESLPKYSEFKEKNGLLDTLTNNKNEQEKMIHSLSGSILSDKTRLTNIAMELETLKSIESDKIRIENEKQSVLRIKEGLEELKKKIAVCESLKEKLGNQQKDFKSKDKEFNDTKKIYSILEQRFYTEQAGVLAEKLQDEYPCPVCGSLKHPNPAVKSENAPTQAELEAKKEKLDNIQIIWQKSSESAGNCKTELDANQKQLIQDALKLDFPRDIQLNDIELELSKRYETVEAILRQKELMQQDADKKYLEKQGLETEQAALLKQKEQNDISLLKANEELSKTNIDISVLQSEILSLQSNLEFENETNAKDSLTEKQLQVDEMKKQLSDTQKEYQIICDALAIADGLVKDNLPRLDIAKANLEKAKTIFENKLAENGFSSEQAYIAALMKEDEIQEAEKTINCFNIEWEKTNAAISELKESVSGKEKSDIEALEGEQNILKVNLGKLREQLQHTDYIIKTNANIMDNLIQKQKEREKIEKLYGEIKLLSDTAIGELTGKQKLPFEQYVQGVYFDMVLVEANKRFKKMTDNRYLLVRREEASNLRNMTGLELDVEDAWTGKKRNVKSLSGGESFKAS